MTDLHHIVCPTCGGVNRTPSAQDLRQGKCGKCSSALASDVPVEISGAAAVKLLTRDEGDYVVDAWAPWCGPCRMLAPAYAAAAERYAGRLRLFKVNVDESPDVAQLLNVRGIPALFIQSGGKLLDQRSGLMSADQLFGWIESVLADHA